MNPLRRCLGGFLLCNPSGATAAVFVWVETMRKRDGLRMKRNLGYAYDPGSECDNGERRTIEVRLNELNNRMSDISSVASHIHRVLFGCEDMFGEPLDERNPSIESTISDIEEHVRDTSKVLEEISSALSNAKRLKVDR